MSCGLKVKVLKGPDRAVAVESPKDDALAVTAASPPRHGDGAAGAYNVVHGLISIRLPNQQHGSRRKDLDRR